MITRLLGSVAAAATLRNSRNCHTAVTQLVIFRVNLINNIITLKVIHNARNRLCFHDAITPFSLSLFHFICFFVCPLGQLATRSMCPCAYTCAHRATRHCLPCLAISHHSPAFIRTTILSRYRHTSSKHRDTLRESERRNENLYTITNSYTCEAHTIFFSASSSSLFVSLKSAITLHVQPDYVWWTFDFNAINTLICEYNTLISLNSFPLFSLLLDINTHALPCTFAPIGYRCKHFIR